MLEFVAEHVGRPRLDSLQRIDRGHGHGRQPGHGRVFSVEVETDGGERAIVVKCFDSPRTHAQERDALTSWCQGRGLIGGARVPELVAVDDGRRMLACGRLRGTAPTRDEPAIHRAAGRFLAGLHGIVARDEDPLPLSEALARRYRAWLQACAEHLQPSERRVVDRYVPRPELFADIVRAPCHRDFTPSNWLWDGRTLAVIDFEHARLDLALADLAKLAVGWWARRPDLELAFFEGYGRVLSAAERTRLRTSIVGHGLASLAWGLRHDAGAFVSEGRRALAVADTAVFGGTVSSREPL